MKTQKIKTITGITFNSEEELIKSYKKTRRIFMAVFIGIVIGSIIGLIITILK